MAKILIAEDERDIRDLIEFTLNYAGHEVIKANNGAEVVEMAPQVKPDLIILDLMMPELDGFDVLEALRKNQDTATIPVIVSTAKELTVDEKNRLGGKIQALLQKGNFLNDEFLDEVKSLIKS